MTTKTDRDELKVGIMQQHTALLCMSEISLISGTGWAVLNKHIRPTRRSDVSTRCESQHSCREMNRYELMVMLDKNEYVDNGWQLIIVTTLKGP